MSTNGLLSRPGIFDQGRASMLADRYIGVEVWRSSTAGDVRVAAFQSRLTATSSADSGRDGQAVQGNSAQRVLVCLAPRGADCEKGDEVWVGDERYRIFAVDSFPHGLQLLIQEIQ
jgi:hypothetical protein